MGLSIQSYSQQTEAHGGSPEEARCKLPEFSLSRVIQEVLDCPGNELSHVCKLFYQGRSLETLCPGFLLGQPHDTSAWHTHIPDSQKENRCST